MTFLNLKIKGHLKWLEHLFQSQSVVVYFLVIGSEKNKTDKKHFGE